VDLLTGWGKMKKRIAGHGAVLDKHVLKTVKKILGRKKQEEELIRRGELLVERVQTGIKGFDNLVEGGIPKNFLVLVTGGPGTGKTIFGIEFLVKGVLMGERGVYLTLEEESEKIEKQSEQFGWPVTKLEKENNLLVLKSSLYDFSKLKELIQDNIVNFGAKRLVIDSISLLGLYFKDAFTIRRALLDMEKGLREIECTTIVISETQSESGSLSPFGVEEFIADGIVLLYMAKKNGEFKRGITVRKMRLTNHSLKIHPLKITKKGGIEVEHSKEFSA